MEKTTTTLNPEIGLETKTVINRNNWGKQFQVSKYLLLMFLPCFLYYLLFKYLPIFGIVISFKDYNLFKGVWASEWVGLKHYYMLFENPDFFKLMRNTFLLGFYKLIFGFPAPIIFALLLNEVRLQVVKRFVQSVSYLPHFISNVIVVSMAMMFLSPSNGIINKILAAVGVGSINFLAESDWFRTIYVITEIWQGLGWESIIYLAALTAVSPELYEAAEMDGAGRFTKMRHVSIPGISMTIVILLILNIGKILEIGFEKVFLLYTPATYETADIISTYVYRVGLISGNFSYASAIDLFMGIIGLIFIYSANYFSRKLGDNSLW